MTLYELMLRTNHYLIRADGPPLTDAQKSYIVRRFLGAQSSPDAAQRFYAGVRYAGNRDAAGRRMYPECFIPPYNDGQKFRSVLGQLPKTHIFSANLYELEILRLLALFSRGEPQTDRILAQALDRLQTTCFGTEDDGIGECFDSSLVVLRFLAAAAPQERSWMQSRIDAYNRHKDDKKRTLHSELYYLLCLSELPWALAQPELDRRRDRIAVRLAAPSTAIHTEHDKTYQPLYLCILRSALSRYPQYTYVNPFSVIVTAVCIST